MKNKITILLSFAFFTIFMVSCKVQKERCAAYGKINKIETIKNIADKTQKSI